MKRSWRSQLFILVFLAIQIALPIRGLIIDAGRPPGGHVEEFAWSMYAHTKRSVVEYTAWTPDGRSMSIDWRRPFRGRGPAAHIIRPDRLRVFHAWLCEATRAEGDVERVTARVVLLPRGERRARLVRPVDDICTAENYGVIDPQTPR